MKTCKQIQYLHGLAMASSPSFLFPRLKHSNNNYVMELPTFWPKCSLLPVFMKPSSTQPLNIKGIATHSINQIPDRQTMATEQVSLPLKYFSLLLRAFFRLAIFHLFPRFLSIIQHYPSIVSLTSPQPLELPPHISLTITMTDEPPQYASTSQDVGDMDDAGCSGSDVTIPEYRWPRWDCLHLVSSSPCSFI